MLLLLWCYCSVTAVIANATATAAAFPSLSRLKGIRKQSKWHHKNTVKERPNKAEIKKQNESLLTLYQTLIRDKFLLKSKPKHSIKTTGTDRNRVFAKDAFVSGDKQLLYCRWCNIVLDHHQRSGITAHLTTDKHRKRKLENRAENLSMIAKLQTMLTLVLYGSACCSNVSLIRKPPSFLDISVQ
ncbi:CGG triplet repeat-binding protein 1-like [Plakobranchus ocellatus]|uniref:CGG triplet repeat-binding protein 1-like n=1 Tax=Plakobranchus ocellatus TaxID=259542 RepID=A0AAV4CVX9_9GAST|nr:CGG triplet repeat-binding protein 1-like [Plakobranchus ocellatus]